MLDIVAVLTLAALFALSGLYVLACRRLKGDRA